MSDNSWEQIVVADLVSLYREGDHGTSVETGKAPNTSAAAAPLAALAKGPVEGNPFERGDVVTCEIYEEFGTKGKWSSPRYKIEAIPFIPIEAPWTQAPVPSGDYLLWPNPFMSSVFFARTIPRLISFSLTVRIDVQADQSMRVIGGDASLTVSLYDADNLHITETNRQAWSKSLEASGYSLRPWRFEPLNLRDLQTTLDLPAGYALGTPQISISASTGLITYLIGLTEIGVLAWRDALNARHGDSIQGMCNVTASYLASKAGELNVLRLPLVAGLGRLLIDRGPGDVHTLYPQQTVESKLVISGHDLIDTVTVNLSPNTGQAPASHIFDSYGGQINIAITTQDPNTVEIGWTAAVRYKSVKWPIVPAAGKMAFTNAWTDIIKPDSWIVDYTLMVIMVEDDGNPTPAKNVETDCRVQGNLTYTAPYIPVTGLLSTAFELTNQTPVTTALPRFPGQPLGDLVLNVFATRAGRSASTSRRLQSSENWVVAKIYRGSENQPAKIELKTALDAPSEISTEGNMLSIMQMLH
jgi:hypothetical protein